MKKTQIFVYHILICAVSFLVFLSCASESFISVNYSLPKQSDEMKGKRVFIAFEDARTDKTVLGPNAQKEFGFYTDRFSFFLTKKDSPKTWISVYDVNGLFTEAVKRRFQNMGTEIMPEPLENELNFKITLKEFKITLVKSNWLANITYDANLSVGEKLVSSQEVKGNIEQVNFIGRLDADMMVGEIFTDSINKLNVAKMFKDIRYKIVVDD